MSSTSVRVSTRLLASKSWIVLRFTSLAVRWCAVSSSRTMITEPTDAPSAKTTLPPSYYAGKTLPSVAEGSSTPVPALCTPAT
ncbi:hypothetical protein ACFL1R_04580 [Candidatus Latescibacterota bacterium]